MYIRICTVNVTEYYQIWYCDFLTAHLHEPGQVEQDGQQHHRQHVIPKKCK